MLPAVTAAVVTVAAVATVVGLELAGETLQHIDQMALSGKGRGQPVQGIAERLPRARCVLVQVVLQQQQGLALLEVMEGAGGGGRCWHVDLTTAASGR